jgi:Protein of unknown function (DUF3071)
MQELRFVAVSEDGSYAVLAIPGRSGRFMLPIDDRLRAVARGQFSRLAQYEIEVENPLRPKEIQARIRAGETVEEIADAAGIPADRVRWFEGPVLAERGYVAQQAQNASVRRQGDSTPGPRLGEVVAERLTELGADPEDAQWDSRKHGDGSWQVQLAFRAGGRLHIAEWLFDPRRRHVTPADDNAERLSLPEAELPPPSGGSLGAATVTPIRPRPDRREAAPQHQAVAEPVEEPARAAAHAASPSFTPSRPPAGRPPSHAAPHPNGGSRPAAADDQRYGAAQQPDRQPETRSPAAEAPAAATREQERPAAATASHATAPAAPAPAAPAPAAAAPAASAPAASASAAAPTAGNSDAERAAAGDASPERAASSGAAPAQTAPQAPQAPPQPAAEKRADEAPVRGRGKKAAGPRGRRSSVPSWDEIMLGNSRQPE